MANNIVFIRSMRFFGGQLIAYPLLHQIKQLFPADRLTVVADDALDHHYTNTPWVDHFVQARPVGEKLKILRNKTKRVFTLHHSSEKYALLSTLCRVSARVGFRNRRLSDLLWTHSYRKDRNEYVAVANLQLLRRLNDFDIETAARDSMLALAADATPELPKYDVVLMPGGSRCVEKRWPIGSFLELTDRLRKYLGPDARFCFIVGPDEEPEAELLQSIQQPDMTVMVSPTLADIAQVTLTARIVIANDCGPSHIAQNAGAPYVTILDEHDPQWFWQRKTSRCVLPDDGSNNIRQVTVDRVFDACREVLV